MLADEPPLLDPEQLLDMRRFAGLAEVDLGDAARLLSIATERSLANGTQLARPGSPLTAAWFILEGELQVRAGNAEYRARIHENVGFLEMLSDAPDGLEIVSVGSTLVLEIEKADFFTLLADHFEGLLDLLRSLCAEILRLSPFEPALPNRARPPASAEPLTFVQRLLLLRELSDFEDAGLSTTAEIALAVHEAAVSGTLVRAGEQVEYLYAVVRGRLRYGGVELPAGSAFGGVHAIAETPLAEDLIAEPGCVVLPFSVQSLFDMLEDDLPFAFAWLKAAAAILVELTRTRGGAAPQR